MCDLVRSFYMYPLICRHLVQIWVGYMKQKPLQPFCYAPDCEKNMLDKIKTALVLTRLIFLMHGHPTDFLQYGYSYCLNSKTRE